MSLQITVSEIKGVTLLCESHIVSFGPGGLLKVPERLGNARDHPPWCLAKIMHDLRQEFDEKYLMYVETKAIRFMASNARVYKRLKNLTEQDWANMRVADRKRQEALKTEIERSSESWKNSPYK